MSTYEQFPEDDQHTCVKNQKNYPRKKQEDGTWIQFPPRPLLSISPLNIVKALIIELLLRLFLKLFCAIKSPFNCYDSKYGLKYQIACDRYEPLLFNHPVGNKGFLCNYTFQISLRTSSVNDFIIIKAMTHILLILFKYLNGVIF